MTLIKVKNRYPMVRRYVESKKRKWSQSTGDLAIERLNTVLDELTANHGVFINEEWLEGLTSTKLHDWFQQFTEGKKDSTCNNYVAFINPFLRWAFDMNYLAVDVSRVLKTYAIKESGDDEAPEGWNEEEETHVDKYLTHEQAARLLTMPFPGRNAARNKAIVALFLYSGIRVSELCSLTIKSVRLSPRGKLYCKRKGGNSSYVEVSEEWYDYVGEYLASRSDLDNNDAPLFMSERGGPMDRRSVYLAIAPIQKSLGIATGPHALRHTYISEMDKIGGPSIARDLANHKSLHVTNGYDHTTEEQRRKAISRLSWTTQFNLPE